MSQESTTLSLSTASPTDKKSSSKKDTQPEKSIAHRTYLKGLEAFEIGEKAEEAEDTSKAKKYYLDALTQFEAASRLDPLKPGFLEKQAQTLRKLAAIEDNPAQQRSYSIKAAKLRLQALELLDIQNKNSSRRTDLLIEAAIAGDEESIDRLLLDPKLNINKKGKEGKTALMWAAKKGHIGIVEKLITKKAELDTQSTRPFSVIENWTVTYTALTLAIIYNQIEVVKALVRAGANVNTQNREVWTPLMYAARYNRTEIAEILLGAGADRSMETMFLSGPSSIAGPGYQIPSKTAYTIAKKHNRKDIQNLLILYAHIDDDKSPLPTLNKLLEEPSPVLFSFPTIHYVLSKITPATPDNANSIRASIKASSDLDALYKHLAAKKPDEIGSLIKLISPALIEPPEDCKTFPSELPLSDSQATLYSTATEDKTHQAKAAELAWLKKELKDTKSTNVNRIIEEDTGNTMLMLAAKGGHTEIVIAILKIQGIKWFLTNKHGKDASILAKENGHHEIEKIILGLILISHIDYNRIQEACSLLESKASLETQYTMDETPLLHAAWVGNKHLIQKLLEAKANLDHQDKKGDTAVSIAARNKRADVLEVLLAAEPNLNLPAKVSIFSLKRTQISHYLDQNSFSKNLHQLFQSIKDGDWGNVKAFKHWDKTQFSIVTIKYALSKFMNTESGSSVPRLLILKKSIKEGIMHNKLSVPESEKELFKALSKLTWPEEASKFIRDNFSEYTVPEPEKTLGNLEAKKSSPASQGPRIEGEERELEASPTTARTQALSHSVLHTTPKSTSSPTSVAAATTPLGERSLADEGSDSYDL